MNNSASREMQFFHLSRVPDVPPQHSIQQQEVLLPCSAEFIKCSSWEPFHSVLWRQQNSSLWPVGLSSVLFTIFPSCSSVLDEVESGLLLRPGRGDGPPPALLSWEIHLRAWSFRAGARRLVWWEAVGIDRNLERNLFPLTSLSPSSYFLACNLSN